MSSPCEDPNSRTNDLANFPLYASIINKKNTPAVVYSPQPTVVDWCAFTHCGYARFWRIMGRV